MPKVVDLTGREVDGWTVLSPADTVKRIRFWNVIHDQCGELAVRPHAMLTTKAVAPCPVCSPATEVGITLGHHQGPGDPAHLVGTPCAETRKCGHGIAGTYCGTCFPVGHEAPARMLAGEALNLKGAIVHGRDFPSPNASGVAWNVQTGWTIPDLAPCPEPLKDAHQLVDAGSGIVSWSGRAEAAAEAQTYLAVIRQRITQPAKASYVGTGRSPGMSALGGCERKLGGLLAFGKPLSSAWRPAIGTAADEYHLGPAFEDDNLRMVRAALESQAPVVQPGRWVTKAKVSAGDPKAYGILDLFDRWTGEVLDFKVSGVTKLDATRKGQITDQYETQLDLYGLGMTLLGYTVRSVALLVLPMGGRSCELEDASYYRRTWDPDNATRALARRDRIIAQLAVADPQTVLESLSIQEDACEYCPVQKMGLCEGVNVRQDKGLAQIGWNPQPISLPAPPPGV